MSTIKLFCFATHNHKLLFSSIASNPYHNVIQPYHLKKSQNPYWIRTIRTRWHVCNTWTMCEFHDCNCNGFGDMWWTDKCTYFSSIDVQIFINASTILLPEAKISKDNDRPHYNLIHIITRRVITRADCNYVEQFDIKSEHVAYIYCGDD